MHLESSAGTNLLRRSSFTIIIIIVIMIIIIIAIIIITVIIIMGELDRGQLVGTPDVCYSVMKKKNVFTM